MAEQAPKPGDKQRYILGLILAVAALMPAVVWLALLAAERDRLGGGWGSPVEMAATLLVVLLVVALGVAAFKLSRVLEYIDPEQIDFPALSESFSDSGGRLAAYLERPPPRPFEAACLAPIWNGLFPPAARLAIALLLPLMLIMLALLSYMVLGATEADRIIDQGPVNTALATVTSVEEKRDRNNGRYFETRYRFKAVAGTTDLHSMSFADHTELRPGDLAPVEYMARDPSLNRLEGMRTTPIDPNAILLPVGAITLVFLPSFGVYVWWRRRFARVLLTEGVLVDAAIESLRRGGRGAVFCKVEYRLRGLVERKRLAVPADPSLYATLHNRRQRHQTIKVLAHPERFGSVYLIEPILAATR
jgi:hypothetical protein